MNSGGRRVNEHSILSALNGFYIQERIIFPCLAERKITRRVRGQVLICHREDFGYEYDE